MSIVWGVTLCVVGRWVPTPDSVRGFNAWIACEKPAGNPGQWNNPLNTKEPGFGGSNALSNGVKQYPTPMAGARATVATIRNGNYPAIVAALNGGRLGYAIAHDGEAQANLGVWGTGASCPVSKLHGRVASAVSAGTAGSPTTPAGTPGASVLQTITGTTVAGFLVGSVGIVATLAVLGVGGYLIYRKVGR